MENIHVFLENRHFSWKQTLVPNTDIFSFTEEIAY